MALLNWVFGIEGYEIAECLAYSGWLRKELIYRFIAWYTLGRTVSQSIVRIIFSILIVWLCCRGNIKINWALVLSFLICNCVIVLSFLYRVACVMYGHHIDRLAYFYHLIEPDWDLSLIDSVNSGVHTSSRASPIPGFGVVSVGDAFYYHYNPTKGLSGIESPSYYVRPKPEPVYVPDPGSVGRLREIPLIARWGVWCRGRHIGGREVDPDSILDAAIRFRHAACPPGWVSTDPQVWADVARTCQELCGGVGV